MIQSPRVKDQILAKVKQDLASDHDHDAEDKEEDDHNFELGAHEDEEEDEHDAQEEDEHDDDNDELDDEDEQDEHDDGHEGDAEMAMIQSAELEAQTLSKESHDLAADYDHDAEGEGTNSHNFEHA